MFTIKKPEYTNKSVRLPDDLIEQLEEIAKIEDISFNQVVIQCCEYAVEHFQPMRTGQIRSTRDFIKNKKALRSEFIQYFSKHSKATPQSLSQRFTDAIFSSQPRHSELNIDFYQLLTGKISLGEYQTALTEYFKATDKKDPVALAKDYTYSFTVLKNFLKEHDCI
ncbi:MAG: ribbon-helix-helix domain-containing protein [Oscillospiraceae bacterium]|jgi:hypothetical protein|nr:ribbon-helix-helix domain-containing protein [Oscillospiraceae bacterium]